MAEYEKKKKKHKFDCRNFQCWETTAINVTKVVKTNHTVKLPIALLPFPFMKGVVFTTIIRKATKKLKPKYHSTVQDGLWSVLI